jgi:Zn-dependent peptidase ImmA (M78 family)
VTLPRGFKAAAEREAVRLRGAMGLRPTDGLSIRRLAAHLDVKVVSADQLVITERLEELERLQAFAYSAATFEILGRCYIVTNPLRSVGRLTSDVAHELAHMLLKHELTEIRDLAGVPFRTCRPDEEEQATAFGATLMLPRPLLEAAALGGLGPGEIAADNEVTIEMARYRYNTTGVAKLDSRSGD